MELYEIKQSLLSAQDKLNALKDKTVDQDTLKDLEKYLNKIEKILQKM